MVSEDRKHDGYVGTMTIRENMTLSIMDKISKHTFIQKKEEKAVVHKFFDYLKIKAPSSETSITSLSGGNQQKVIISRALATDMKVLFLDEPTRGIDVGAKAEIYKIINELAEEGLHCGHFLGNARTDLCVTGSWYSGMAGAQVSL